VPGEECDDGNTMTEVCTYGMMSCTGCDMTCHSVDGATSFCGDGVVDAANEACDDHNALACGSCGLNCQAITSARATGTIVVLKANDLVDGETFTLNDGVNTPTTFEFDKDDTFTMGNVQVNIGATPAPSASTVRSIVVAAINGVGATLEITASGTSAVVNLTHDRFSTIGNQALTETVADQDFSISNMTGGLGGDCMAMTPCSTDADCLSNSCMMNVCQ